LARCTPRAAKVGSDWSRGLQDRARAFTILRSNPEGCDSLIALEDPVPFRIVSDTFLTAGSTSLGSVSNTIQFEGCGAPRARGARLVKSQCTCSSGFSRVTSVTVGPCFKCDRSLVALAAVSNHGYPSKKAHLFHADIQRVRAQRLRLAIRSRCRHGGFDCVMQKRAGIESLTDHANGPERHLTHAGRKWAEQHRRRCASID